ncbi:MAG TPA: hypothetical protein VNT32_00030 [Thermoleophilaceae bacterium]|nr:hypothetical protein [Thermoleophilaceae bacterium]
MFPARSVTPRSPAFPPAGLRARLVRGLDLAVEFATLGEFGVEEAPSVAAPVEDTGWEWPLRHRASGDCGRPRRRREGPHALASGRRGRDRAGSVMPPEQACPLGAAASG